MDDDMLVEHGKDTTQMWVKYEDCVQEIALTKADAQATIAALQARVKELEESRDAWKASQECSEKAYMELVNQIPAERFDYDPVNVALLDGAKEQEIIGRKQIADLQGLLKRTDENREQWRKLCQEAQSQLTQRTAECDALKLVNDTHMKTVMKLSHVVEQRTAERDCARRRVDELEAREVDVVLLREDLEKRTAELEAAKRERDEIIQASIKEPIHEPVTYQALAGARSVAKLAYGELIKMTKRRDDLQAELERVRGQFADLRKMVAALPKVEGKIEVHTFKNTNQVVVTYNRGIIIGTLYGLDHAKPVAALYEHRQGMEG